MNENPPTPLTADQIDELLSAELDGELASAASDLGLDPTRVDELLAASPGVDARRHDLATARDAIAAVEPLDELTAARLRATALAAAGEVDSTEDAPGGSRSRRRVEWMSVAALVAVAVVIFGIVGVTRNTSSPSHSVAATELSPSGAGGEAHRSAAAQTVPAAAPGYVLFGNVASSDQLAQLAQKSIATHGKFNISNDFSAGNATNDGASVLVPSAATTGTSGSCEDSARKAVASTSAPVILGSANLANEPVSVFVYPHDQGYEMVVSGADCRIVHRQAFPK
jgi:hypothetical protein